MPNHSRDYFYGSGARTSRKGDATNSPSDFDIRVPGQIGEGPPEPPPAVAAPAAPVEDWTNRTSIDAARAGVRRAVLCSDGYYVPPKLHPES